MLFRSWHPIAAAITGLILVTIAKRIASERPNSYTQKLSQVIVALFIVEFLLGTLNAVLNAPLYTQMVHLLMADLFWITLVLLGAAALGTGNEGATR